MLFIIMIIDFFYLQSINWIKFLKINNANYCLFCFLNDNEFIFFFQKFDKITLMNEKFRKFVEIYSIEINKLYKNWLKTSTKSFLFFDCHSLKRTKTNILFKNAIKIENVMNNNIEIRSLRMQNKNFQR